MPSNQLLKILDELRQHKPTLINLEESTVMFSRFWETLDENKAELAKISWALSRRLMEAITQLIVAIDAYKFGAIGKKKLQDLLQKTDIEGIIMLIFPGLKNPV
ncbi:MAG: hypothetical protein ACFFBS_00045 [Promethearchaeota archaeon]